MEAMPLVSICCLTFNHENYVREALDGFLNQKTNFAFEILVHDDASTDATASIIKEYQQEFPDIVKPILQKENQFAKGISGTFSHNLPRALGKYITICEGDDYWIDNEKLQSQVDFLEANPDYGLVHTDFDILYETSGKKIESSNKAQGFNYEHIEDEFNQLLKKNHIATCTVLFKKELLDSIKFEDIKQFSHKDLVLWIEMTQQTKFKYLNRSTAVYRVRSESLSNSQSTLKRLNFLIGSKEIKLHYSTKYGNAEQIRSAQYDYYHRVLIRSVYNLNKNEAALAYKKLPFKTNKDHIFFVISRFKGLNKLFFRLRKV